jgi:hypothetical protein
VSADIKILHIDLETSPANVLVWDLYKPHIGVDQIIEPTSILCFAAKWHGAKDIIFERSLKRDGAEFKKMIRRAHDLLSEADALCHYNGNSFDTPRLNAEFAKLGLPPPPTIPQIDLLRVVQQKFGLTSNKLAFVAPYMKVGEKVKNAGWELWRGCLDGDLKCWAEMEEYNRGDVWLLERLYERLRPWIDNHPNLNLFVDSKEPVCPNCGSEKLQSRGEHVTTTYIYARYHCRSCGRWSRARKRDKQFKAAERR